MLTGQKVVSKRKKIALVRGKDNKVGLVRPEPGSLVGSPKPVENMSDGVGSQAASDAAFNEAGNRHLNAPLR